MFENFARDNTVYKFKVYSIAQRPIIDGSKTKKENIINFAENYDCFSSDSLGEPLDYILGQISKDGKYIQEIKTLRLIPILYKNDIAGLNGSSKVRYRLTEDSPIFIPIYAIGYPSNLKFLENFKKVSYGEVKKYLKRDAASVFEKLNGYFVEANKAYDDTLSKSKVIDSEKGKKLVRTMKS